MDSSTESSSSSNESEDDVQECGLSEAFSKIESLPERSRERYIKVYESFVEWKTSKGFQFFSEDVFLEYFRELAKTKRATTLWVIYSMLRSTVGVRHDVQINTYSKLVSFLKIQSKGQIIRKSKLFTAQDIETFLRDAPDNIYLVMKVALVFGINGACRAFELVGLRTVDIEKHSDQLMLINIMKSPKLIDRSFIIRNEYVKLVEKYQALRPSRMDNDRFFVSYHNGKCTRQAIGRNTINSFPRKIAMFLDLPNPELYTGHCYKNAAGLSGLAQSGANSLMIRQSGRLRTDTVNVKDIARKATMRLRSANPNWKPKPPRSLLESSETPHESPAETQHSESSVSKTQSANTQQREPLVHSEQVKLEWSECPADESLKSDEGFDQMCQDYELQLSPIPQSPEPSRVLPFRQLAALERRRLRLDEVRARQLHARETRRLRVEARRVEVDREKNEVLRRIADVAFALLEKTMGNGMLRH